VEGEFEGPSDVEDLPLRALKSYETTTERIGRQEAENHHRPQMHRRRRLQPPPQWTWATATNKHAPHFTAPVNDRAANPSGRAIILALGLTTPSHSIHAQHLQLDEGRE
jgi:hypothetical protein